VSKRRLLVSALALGLWLDGTVPTWCEHLVVALSSHRVQINSSFAGTELVLFGSVERDAQTVARTRGYDIVVKVSGPPQTEVTRRKERVAGIWVNVESRTFLDAPSFLAFLSNRPINDLAGPEVLRRNQVGLDNILLPQLISGDIGDVPPNDPFRAAFLRLNRQHGLYREAPDAVTFLTPTLFRAVIALPANIPTGTYVVDVKLLADGVVLGSSNSAIEVQKVGFEQFVATSAREHGLLYGLATAGLALLTGWLASVVFRRD
jgi:uncharacterized protein (TIGR02186 family)